MFRCGWMLMEFAYAAVALAGAATCSTSTDTTWRARWLQRHSRRMLRVFGCRLVVRGTIPAGGFLIANHLSYLDVLLLGAYQPCVFVAKREVRRWPVLGWFAGRAGTIFVNRESRRDAARAVAAMRRVAEQGVLVVLFPEGTSSDGREVLPFKSALLEPLVGESCCAVAHVSYDLRDGSVADEVCYWRDMTLLPHLLNLLGREGLTGELRLGSFDPRGLHRKELALWLRQGVVTLAGGKGLPGRAAVHGRADGESFVACHRVAVKL
jgi:lyso-ornithine lipid O-acyltransferase